MIFKQDTGIPIGTDPVPFWAKLFFFGFKSKFINQLISSGSSKAYKYHRVSRFTDDLCAINDGNEFLTLIKNICPKELELKV